MKVKKVYDLFSFCILPLIESESIAPGLGLEICLNIIIHFTAVLLCSSIVSYRGKIHSSAAKVLLFWNFNKYIVGSYRNSLRLMRRWYLAVFYLNINELEILKFSYPGTQECYITTQHG